MAPSPSQHRLDQPQRQCLLCQRKSHRQDLVFLPVLISRAVSRASGFLQPSGEPARQIPVDRAAGIDLGGRHLFLAQRQQHADPVREPDMRIGQRAQLVLIMVQRLMIGGPS